MNAADKAAAYPRLVAALKATIAAFAEMHPSTEQFQDVDAAMRLLVELDEEVPSEDVFYFCHADPYRLDTPEKVEWANGIRASKRYQQLGVAPWRIGDDCFYAPRPTKEQAARMRRF